MTNTGNDIECVKEIEERMQGKRETGTKVKIFGGTLPTVKFTFKLGQGQI